MVVDDGSTDDTRARCLAYGDRIRLVTRPNGGASAARNTGVAMARGTYIAHLDGDDLWHPEKIAVQVDAARRFPEAGMVVVDGHKFRDDGPDERGLIRGAVGALLATAPEGRFCVQCYDAVMRGHFVATPSQFMVPATVYHVLGPWETRLRLIADSEMLLRIALRYPIAFVAGDYVGYRYLPSSISGPEETRGFSWGLELFPMLRFHRRHAGAAHEAAIRARARTSVTALAQDAYYRGHRVDRAWARRYLLRLLVASRQPRFHLWARSPIGLRSNRLREDAVRPANEGLRPILLPSREKPFDIASIRASTSLRFSHPRSTESGPRSTNSSKRAKSRPGAHGLASLLRQKERRTRHPRRT